MKDFPDWTYSYAELICSKCGAEIHFCDTNWQTAEMKAYGFNLSQSHVCGMRHITPEEAKLKMQKYREENPGVSFEEQCKVYNEIMKSQTYI